MTVLWSVRLVRSKVGSRGADMQETDGLAWCCQDMSFVSLGWAGVNYLDYCMECRM